MSVDSKKIVQHFAKRLSVPVTGETIPGFVQKTWMQQYKIMSLPYEVHKTIDHDNPFAKKQFARILNDWKKACYKKVASPKALRKGGRALKRDLARKKCKIEENEERNQLTHEFTAGGRTISILHVTFDNYEPEPAEWWKPTVSAQIAGRISSHPAQ